jgi:hypothetical protein
VLLLAYQQPFASGEPFLAFSYLVVSHNSSIRDRAEIHRSDRDKAIDRSS